MLATKRRTKVRVNIVMSAMVGTNAEYFSILLPFYIGTLGLGKRRANILDATWGRGNFWTYLNQNEYNLIRNDAFIPGLDLREDFRHLSLKSDSLDIFVLDPPYAQHGTPMKSSIAGPYGCDERGLKSEKDFIELYRAGAVEAWRTLRKGGLLILKTQDAIESGKFVSKQAALSSLDGFKHINNHVLVQKTIPAMRYPYQKNARQNHSYFMIFQKV